MSMTVCIQQGKLLIVKPYKNILDENNVFTHDKSKKFYLFIYLCYFVDKKLL